MSDLVERLRTFDTHSNDARAVCDEAADEIERLRDVVMERNKERMKLQAVVDAARALQRRLDDHWGNTRHDWTEEELLAVALCALDGERCPTCGGTWRKG